jgi:hypothetical protein
VQLHTLGVSKSTISHLEGGAEDKRRSRHEKRGAGLTIASGMRMRTASSFLHEGECYLICFVGNAVGSSLL